MNEISEATHVECLEIARQWLFGNLSDAMAEYEMTIRNRLLLGYAELILMMVDEDPLVDECIHIKPKSSFQFKARKVNIRRGDPSSFILDLDEEMK